MAHPASITAFQPRRPDVELAFVPVEKMTPDHEYQRDRKPARVQQIVEEWDDRKIGALLVVPHTDDEGRLVYRVLDGGHRWEAARTKYGVDYELPVVIVAQSADDGDSAADVAGVFLGVNRDRSAVAKWDEFRVALNGGLSPYVDIAQGLQAKIRDGHALGVAQKASPNRIGCVQALLRIHQHHGLEVLMRAVDVLDRLWGRHPETWDADMLQAVARVLGRNTDLEVDHLEKVLAKKSISQWKAAAINRTTTKITSGGSESRANRLADVIMDAYNARRRTRRAS